MGQISLHGTKVKTNASKHKALSHGHLEKREARLREEVQAVLKKAAQADCEELADGIDVPEEIARREDRLEGLGEAKAKIAERVKERDQPAQRNTHSKWPIEKRNVRRVENPRARNQNRRQPVRVRRIKSI